MMNYPPVPYCIFALNENSYCVDYILVNGKERQTLLTGLRFNGLEFFFNDFIGPPIPEITYYLNSLDSLTLICHHKFYFNKHGEDNPRDEFTKQQDSLTKLKKEFEKAFKEINKQLFKKN